MVMRKKNIVIVANGHLKNNAFNKKELNQADLIICVDGGANKIAPFKIIPHYLIGDMDSVKKSVFQRLKTTTTCLLRFLVKSWVCSALNTGSIILRSRLSPTT